MIIRQNKAASGPVEGIKSYAAGSSVNTTLRGLPRRFGASAVAGAAASGWGLGAASATMGLSSAGNGRTSRRRGLTSVTTTGRSSDTTGAAGDAETDGAAGATSCVVASGFGEDSAPANRASR